MADEGRTRALHVEVSGASDRGQARQINEDYVAYRLPDESDTLAEKGVLCVVADGMGGHEAGEAASSRAAESAVRVYYDTRAADPGQGLKAAVTAANGSVYSWAQEQQMDSRTGTTLVAAALQGDCLHVANVGDSRAYLLHDGEIERITKDHSWVQEQVEAGFLSEVDIRTHPRRSVITRALGIDSEVAVDLYQRTMEPGDLVILCSDGLWEPVEDSELAQLALSHPPEEAVQEMVRLANSRGGPDNISVIVLRVAEPPAAQPEPPSQAQATAGHPEEVPSPGRSRVLMLGALVVVLASLGAAGYFLWGVSDAPPAATVTPVNSPEAQPTSTAAGSAPAAESPTSSPVSAETTATLRPTFTPSRPADTATATASAVPSTPTATEVPSPPTATPQSAVPQSTPTPTEGLPSTNEGETPRPTSTPSGPVNESLLPRPTFSLTDIVPPTRTPHDD